MSAFSVRAFILMYGDNFPLHFRLLNNLLKMNHAQLESGELRLTVWGNTVGVPTTNWLCKLKESRAPFTSVLSLNNLPKYQVMRTLFHEPYTEPWTLWWDDDSWPNEATWFQRTRDYILSKQAENICYIGQPWFVHHLPGQWEFIQAAKWYKGVPAQIINGKPGIHFAQGGYWWLRTDVLRQLGWPDERLNHNGGDTLLGSAIQQQGLPFHKFYQGMRINDAPRRGLSEKPAGSTVDTRR